MIAIPILALIGLIAFGVHRQHGEKTASDVQARTSGSLPDMPPNLQRLTYALSAGMEPDRWIVDGAIAEAYSAGQWGLVAKLSKRFPRDLQQKPPAQEAQADTVGVCVGKNSPFDGVTNDAWGKFVSALATEKDEYKTDKHVGRYHHSRARLGQLGIDPDGITTEQAAYEALDRDLQELNRSCKALLDRYICHPVNVRGQDCMMTMSGILGLLKSAGPEAARSWIENPRDRDQYPMTTQMFLATNGMF